ATAPGRSSRPEPPRSAPLPSAHRRSMSSVASGSPAARGKDLAGRRTIEADRTGGLVPGGGRKHAAIRGGLDAGAARRGDPDIRDPQRGGGIVLHHTPVRRPAPPEPRRG